MCIQIIDDVQHLNGRDTAEATVATSDDGGGTSLRVDAQRNLEHVLRAAREVFGELGYRAPMEDVARRARVGVGTVYRRFPSKEALVKRIAQEEMARLAEQARSALGQEEKSWAALSRFLRTSVASGAGRLLPPRILRVGSLPKASGAPDTSGASGTLRTEALAGLRVPQQWHAGDAAADGRADSGADDGGTSELRLVERHPDMDGTGPADNGDAELLDVVGQLVDRAHEAGELRPDVTVADVLLVIATAAPSLPDAAHRAEASTRLLDILLEGLRSRPERRAGELLNRV